MGVILLAVSHVAEQYSRSESDNHLRGDKFVKGTAAHCFERNHQSSWEGVHHQRVSYRDDNYIVILDGTIFALFEIGDS